MRAAVEAAIAGERAIAGFSLAPGHPGSTGSADSTDRAGRADGTDLAVTLRLAAPRADDWAQAANRVAASIAARLAIRLRRGIEVSITH